MTPLERNPCSKNFISFYEGKGVKVCSGRSSVTVTNPTGGIRGEIKGWSRASRRRFRMVLLTCRGEDGTKPYGLTFTVPGVPSLTPLESKALWKDFCRQVERCGITMVWRLEVQERGALHWHGIAWAHDLVPLYPRKKDKFMLHPRGVLYALWFESLSKAPPVERYGDPYFGINGTWKKGIEFCQRNKWPGAKKRAFDCQDGQGARGAWLRYLQDHASKHKQGQIPEDIGRHWGIVGRSRLKSVFPDQEVELTDQQLNAVVRQMQRMSTPIIKCPKAPFGKKLGYRLSRGSRGVSVWFSNTETISRLIEWNRNY